MRPLEYFASAPDGPLDAAILSEVVSREEGSYLERLNPLKTLRLSAPQPKSHGQQPLMQRHLTSPGRQKKPVRGRQDQLQL